MAVKFVSLNPWGKRVGGWGDGGMGGEEGNWELGVGGWGEEGNWELGVRSWGEEEFRVNPNYSQTTRQS
uniref:Uncharacterized protein n=1 Tax=Desertifilum tharense IPPAS B-1220 TaxID=1781255 RepID=A0A1E5QPU3_9CYAN|nr:hypothetical protein BH720_03700 [Desertifilum tharense IPPAS B-1220]